MMARHGKANLHQRHLLLYLVAIVVESLSIADMVGQQGGPSSLRSYSELCTEAVAAASTDPKKCVYFTRGLTSQLFLLDLDDVQDDKRGHDRDTAATYKAGLKAHARKIVVKSVDLEQQSRPHDVAKEARIMAQLCSVRPSESRYILQILGEQVEEQDDFTTIHRLFLPFCPSTLSDVLAYDAQSEVSGASSSSMPPRRLSFAQRVAAQLFGALRFLHTSDISGKDVIYHRDIKPSNILLTSPAESALEYTSTEIRLCDFGTASVSDPTSDSRPKTCSTSTHPYTPPELLFAPTNGYDGSKADIWEAAVVLAEILGPAEEQMPSQGLNGRSALNKPAADDDDDDEMDWPSMGGNLFGKADDDEEWKKADAMLTSGLLSSGNGGVLTSQSGLGAAFGEEDEDDPFSDRPTSKRDSKKLRLHGDASSLFASSLNSSGASAAARPRPLGPCKRKTLFSGNQGDLGLASEVFDLLGLPDADEEALWPEAVHFRPSLSRMPFRRAPPPPQPASLYGKLPILIPHQDLPGDADSEEDDQKKRLTDVILGCLRLSAQSRWTTDQILKRLAES